MGSKNNILLFFIVYIQLMMIVALPTTRKPKTMLVHNTISELKIQHNVLPPVLPVMFHIVTKMLR